MMLASVTAAKSEAMLSTKSGIRRSFSAALVIGLSMLFGSFFAVIALLFVGAVNGWDDAPGLGFLIFGVLLLGLISGLLTGTICAVRALGVKDGVKRASQVLASFSLILGGGLSVWIHDSAYTAKGYVAGLILLILGFLLGWLVVKGRIRVVAVPPRLPIR
jgi:hypothetical protein